MIAKIAAAVALLGMLTGCAGFPNWSANAPADSMQDPAIYTGVSD